MIERHSIDISKLGDTDFLISRINKSIGKLTQNKDLNLGPLWNRSIDLSTSGIIKDRNLESVNLGFRYFIDVGIANFQRAINDQNEVEIIVDGKPYFLNPKAAPEITSYFDWFKIYNIGQLLKEDNRKQELFSLQIEKVNTFADPYWLLVYRFINAIENDKMDEVNKIYENIQSSSKSGVGKVNTLDGPLLQKINGRQAMMNIFWDPIIALYYHAYHKNQQFFNEILENFLINKKQFISDNELTDNVQYFIDYNALACCKYASKNLIEIKIESDYIPSWIYN